MRTASKCASESERSALRVGSGQRGAVAALLSRTCPSFTIPAAACVHAALAPSSSGWKPMPTGKAGEISSAAQLAFTSATARAQIAEAQVVGRPMALGPQVSPSWVQHTPCANSKASFSSMRLDASVVPHGSSGPPPPPPPPWVTLATRAARPLATLLSGPASAAETKRARNRAQAFICTEIRRNSSETRRISSGKRGKSYE
jgi:hypothetical protein